MKIAAIVVTYNRFASLIECIDAIRKQTVRPDDIIVVDNGSSDDTPGWLMMQNDLTIITQENSGGSGGQKTGIAFAVENGYDWVWCFDDDCYPDKRALEQLIPHMKKNDEAVYNSVPLFNDNTFSFFAYGAISYAEMMKKVVNNVYTGFQGGYFYIGCAIPRRIVYNVGLPIAEMFIRGDEVEYHSRIAQHYPVFTIPSSIVYHPKEEYFYIEPARIFSFRFPKSLTHVKFYYHVRNNMMLSYRYPKSRVRIPFSVIKNAALTLYVVMRYYRRKEFLFAFLRGLKDSIFQYRKIFYNIVKPTQV